MKRFIAILASIFLMAGNVWAANYCSDQIIDETGTINSGQVEKIAQAIKPLSNEGADVKVRILKDLKGHPNLEHLKNSGIEKCGSWKGTQAGSMKNNLVLFIVALTEKKTAVYYGDGLSGRLNGKHQPLWLI